MARYLLWLLNFVLMVSFSFILAQPIPSDFFDSKSRKILYNVGEGWSSLSNFKSPCFLESTPYGLTQKNSDELFLELKTGIKNNNRDLALYSFGRFKFKKYFYGYFYPKITTNITANNDGLDKLTEAKARHFNFSDLYISGFGYQNDWVWIQISRGYENWGAGNDISLALGNENAGYDYLLFGSDYGRLRVNYLHGLLESVGHKINRFITARGIEWSNKKNLIIGLSEIVIYSGENRSLDFGYINPVSSHLEIELNNRLNNIGIGNANAVWQAHFDLMIKNKVRVSLNFLFDEFVFDPDIEIGKEHGKAYSAKLSYGLKKSNNHIFSLYSSIIKIGTPTFRHGNGMNNFVNRGIPLGAIEGSDVIDLQLGVNYFNRKNFISSLAIKNTRTGSENIMKRPYEPFKDYLKETFPSGQVLTVNSLEMDIEWWWRSNTSLSLTSQINTNQQKKGNEISFQIRFNIFLDKILLL